MNNYLNFVSKVKANDKKRSLVVTISTKNPDRSRDVVMPRGVVMDNYLKNPVVAYGHDYRGLAIGKADGIEVMDDRIVASVTFPDEGVYPFADQVYRLYKDGFMSAWSIGFMPIKALDLATGGKQFDEWELLEFSAVLVPDNPEALTMLRSKGYSPDEMKDFTDVLESKAVIPYRDLGTSDPNTAWDGPAQISQADISDLKLMSCWYDSQNPDVKASYKLPHHLAGENNPAVLRGVYAAMGALLGARGGVNIPDVDRKGVYNHLAKHYAQYDVQPPEFKVYEQREIDKLFLDYTLEIEDITKCDCLQETKYVVDDTISDGGDNEKSGRVLSGKTRKHITSVIEQINAMTETFKGINIALTTLMELSDTPTNTETDKTVVDLTEGLKVADKAIGLVLRKLKEVRS